MSTPDLDATFAFVDLAGYTAVTEAHGDHQALAIIQAFRARTREVLGRDDEIVKTIGDAVMLRFPTPDDAVVALQELIRREISAPDAVLLPRAGAHHGSAVAIDGDYYGAAVNLAARVAGQAKAGQLLVTSRVASAAQHLGSVVRHLGTADLRNVANPVDLYEVRMHVESIETATDLVCQMRVPTAAAHAISLEWSGRHYHFCGLPCVARFAAAPDTFLARAISNPTPAARRQAAAHAGPIERLRGGRDLTAPAGRGRATRPRTSEPALQRLHQPHSVLRLSEALEGQGDVVVPNVSVMVMACAWPTGSSSGTGGRWRGAHSPHTQTLGMLVRPVWSTATPSA